MLGYIYKITNKINGKIYIGQHSKSDLSLTELDQSYWASGIKIKNAFQKYGLENFNREILEWCSTYEELNTKEKDYIKLYDATNDSKGYNIAAGGSAGYMVAGYTEDEKQLWKEHISAATRTAMSDPNVYEKFMQAIKQRSNNDEWKRKISDAAKQQHHPPMSDQTKQQIRERMIGNQYGVGNKSNTGRRLTDEHKQHISDGAKKVQHTPKWNAKVSQSLRGIKRSEETKNKLRRPKPKYKWQLPDGSTAIMSASNGSRHPGWIRMEEVKM